MKSLKFGFCALGLAAVLAGCGGGDIRSPEPRYSAMVVFGDSLSDIGTYKVSAIATAGGGKYTVNSPTARNWTEILAARYNLVAPCPAQTGLASIISSIPAAPVQNFSNCRNYAQGSSRVTSPAGPYSVAIQQAIRGAALQSGATAAQADQTAIQADFGLGVLASPIVNQMANHLTNAGGSYNGKELVTILAGGNDAFLNLSGVQQAAAGGANAVAAARFAGWPAGVQASVAAGGAAAAGAAQQAAVAGMAQAATELVAAINTQVIGKGAKYVAVGNLPDLSQTPFAAPLDAATKGFIRTLVTTFNSTLRTGLAGKPEVTLVDLYAQGQDQIANPGKYGLSNVANRACSTASPANPVAPSALACTSASVIPGDTSRFLFADDVHLTPFGYELVAQAVAQGIVAANWP
ncbi:MAG: hypothetical protein JWP47_2520 [Polaromonas sp.]|jgi:outer membrane lipase/esterase|nr:hypothetical protein [Polaromonas sp.]